MKKSIIFLIVVLKASCATTGLNFFDTIDKLTISEYQSLTHRQQLLVCGGFLIASCQFDGQQFFAWDVSAVKLHNQVSYIINKYNPADTMIVSVFNIAMAKCINTKQNA